MSAHIDIQIAHDLLKHVALGDRTVIHGKSFSEFPETGNRRFASAPLR